MLTFDGWSHDTVGPIASLSVTATVHETKAEVELRPGCLTKSFGHCVKTGGSTSESLKKRISLVILQKGRL